jgi:formate/nitrite transporter FocA (FNT family)
MTVLGYNRVSMRPNRGHRNLLPLGLICLAIAGGLLLNASFALFTLAPHNRLVNTWGIMASLLLAILLVLVGIVMVVASFDSSR